MSQVANRKEKTAELFAAGFQSSQIFKETVIHKLSGLAEGGWWVNFQRCGKEECFRTCKQCGDVKTFAYSCNQKWCPACNWKITDRRKEELKLITSDLHQPKHLVLTQRNFPILTRRRIHEARANLVRLRRKKLMKEVKGGCASLEFTNESRGWHMHWHLLLDAKFVDIEKVAIKYGQLVGQQYAIVKIKDVRNQEYLKEVCKYVVTGAELAGWKPELILEFILALQGTRMFSVFGSFIERRKHAKAVIKTRKVGPLCECGCARFEYDSELSAVLKSHRNS